MVRKIFVEIEKAFILWQERALANLAEKGLSSFRMILQQGFNDSILLLCTTHEHLQE